MVGDWSIRSSSGGAYDTVSGGYRYPVGTSKSYSFGADRTFYQITIINTASSRFMQIAEGSWRESGATIYLTYTRYQKSYDGGSTFTPWAPHWEPNSFMKIHHGADERGQYFTNLEFDTNYYKGK